MTLITFNRIQLLLFAIFYLVLSTHAADPRRVCELDINEPSYQNALNSNDWNPNWCTHILLDYATANTGSQLVFKNTNYEEVFAKLSKWKLGNSNLRVYISLTLSKELLALYASWPTKTNKLAKNIIALKNKYDFDGINLKLVNKNQISNESFTFLVNLKTSFVSESEDIQLSLDLPRDYINYNDEDFRLSSFSYYTGFFIIRSYNFHTDHWFFTSFNAPLYKNRWPNRNSVNDLVRLLIKNNIERDRIVISLPVHAVEFTLLFMMNRPGSYTWGSGKTRTRGELCYWFNSSERIYHKFDEKTYEPYSTVSNEWMTYENDKSIIWKLAYLFDEKLGGILMHNINLDNHQNESGNCTSSFTVHRAVNEIISQVYIENGQNMPKNVSKQELLRRGILK